MEEVSHKQLLEKRGMYYNLYMAQVELKKVCNKNAITYVLYITDQWRVGLIMEKEQTNIIDEGIFEKIANGDDAAFTELYYASYRQIYGFLLALTKNKEDAEDLLQNTYIRIRNGSHLYRKQGTPMTWMCAVAKNQFLDFVRKKSKGVSVDFDEVEKYVSEGLGTGVKQHKDVENEMVLEKAFEILNKQERTIVVLHMIDGLKHREISKITGIPLSTVLSKYNRSLKKLREFIKE